MVKQLSTEKKSYILGRVVSWSARKYSSKADSYNLFYKEKLNKKDRIEYIYVPKVVQKTNFLDLSLFKKGLFEGAYQRFTYGDHWFPFPNLSHKDLFHVIIPEYLKSKISNLFSCNDIDKYPGLLLGKLFVIGIKDILKNYKSYVNEMFSNHQPVNDYIYFSQVKHTYPQG